MPLQIICGLLLTLLVLFALSWRKITIWRWRKAFSLNKAEPIFEALYRDVNGFALSHEARRQKDATDYIYGEIDFTSFVALLSLVAPNSNTIFYDLGSGTGKAVLACAMVFNVKECIGVELFQSLHDVACKQLLALRANPNFEPITQQIQFIHHDFLQVSLNKATLVYINATGFIGETWALISQRLENATHCTTVISTSKALKSNAFVVVKVTTVQMSWGWVKAYIQQRK